ncbi:hypothetical protein PAXINDRAFT_152746 [Paxillus involutus ATCC 200175]|nr:hypothetical protein PAXINDRAFT_152746 [Paxillus involutus ATCC 200175]
MDQVVPEGILARRPSTSLDRPARAPFGPRRPKNSIDMNSTAGSSVDGTSPFLSAVTCPTFTNPFSRPDSPGHSRSQSAPQPIVTMPAHIGAEPPFQVPPSPLSPLSPYPSACPPVPEKTTHSSKPSLVATFLPPPPLPPPPVINFESTPIQWKGLPLEAAQWTFSSADLQEIVSRAIRLSAKESFAIEVDILEESERLDAERLAAQAKWRFEVGRRTMLMQALNSTAAMLSSSGEGDMGNVLAGLISQLATKRSARDGPSRFSRISAARVRSRVTSNASLRLPRALRTPSSNHASPVDTPPIPALPENLQGQSFLDMDMGNTVDEVVKRPRRFLPTRHPEPRAALPQPPHTAGLPRTNIPSIWLDGDGGPETRLNGLDRSHSLQIFPSLNTRTPQKGRRSNLVMSLSNSDLGSSMDSPVSADAHRSTRPGSAGARLLHHEEVPRYRSLVGRAGSVLLRRWSQATSSRKHYSSSLPTYRSKEESDTPPRIPTPNTG